MILCTGFRGYIGSKLTKALTEPWVGLDVRDGMNLLTCELPKGIDTIYHLAAQADVVASWKDPLHDLDNIRITARLAHAYPYAKIIYANSSAALDADSPYGFSKRAAGDYLLKFHPNTVNLVFPNIYGEDSRSVVDLFKGKEAVTVYGDGTHTRDYVHVEDIICGLIKAEHWDKGTYFMGSGKTYSVLDLAKGKEVTFMPERKESADVRVKNTTPNWAPKWNVMEYLHD